MEIPPCFPDHQLILNYDDACLYGRDYKLFCANDSWLNDACIHYQFARLTVKYNTASILLSTVLLDPSVASFFMHQCVDQDELSEFSKNHGGFLQTERIIIPLNDTMDPSSNSWREPGQGTHWSLLLIELQQQSTSSSGPQQVYVSHFDSIPASRNQHAARAVAAKWQRLLFVGHDDKNNNESSSSSTVPPQHSMCQVVHECPVPRQTNGFDCGVHVLATAERILSIIANDTDARHYAQNDEDDRLAMEVSNQMSEIFKRDASYCVKLRSRIAADVVSQATRAADKAKELKN